MVYFLKEKTKAFVISDEDKIETEIKLNASTVKRNTIDYAYAYELGLSTVDPLVYNFSGKTLVQEKVQLTLEIPVTNIESKLITIEAELVKHSASLKRTIKVGKKVI